VNLVSSADECDQARNCVGTDVAHSDFDEPFQSVRGQWISHGFPLSRHSRESVVGWAVAERSALKEPMDAVLVGQMAVCPAGRYPAAPSGGQSEGAAALLVILCFRRRQFVDSPWISAPGRGSAPRRVIQGFFHFSGGAPVRTKSDFLVGVVGRLLISVFRHDTRVFARDKAGCRRGSRAARRPSVRVLSISPQGRRS
jgi:hypothetical protein